MVASDIMGVNENAYDFYYIITIDSPIIGGPSAGGALTVATIAAMNNWDIKSGIAMTGMINPDETIGPVGGIPFKLQAASTNNVKLFMVPQGQLIVNITNTTIRRGRLITTQTIEERVDLTKLGKKLNVDVKEVRTIQDAVLEFTGHDIKKPSIDKTVFTSNYLNLLEPLATRLKDESKNMLKDSSSIQNDFIKNAADLQNKADNLAKDKKYYAATSFYFESMINILAAQWNYQYNQENNKDQFITQISENVEKQIKDSEKDLDNAKLNGISDIEVIGAAESRIEEANNILENIKTLEPTNQASNIINSLAFANERAKTAQWWLSLAKPSGKTIPQDVIKERAVWYLGQAQSINTYMQTLISESGSNSVGNIGDTTIVQKEIEKGYYSGALFDSLKSISISSTVIGLLGVEDPSIRIDQSSSSAQDAINEARSKGIEPTLAISAFEYAGTLANPLDKIYQYSYAKNVAKTTESIYYLRNQTVTIPTTNISTPPISSKKSPDFEAIFLIIIIILIMRYKNR